MQKQFPFKNLVFEGGGVKGLAYIGAIEVLEQQGILSRIERVAGTSAGSITATLVSFGLDASRTIKLINSLDFSKVPDTGANDHFDFLPAHLRRELERLLGDLNGVYRLVTQFGWFTSDYFYTWLQDTIAQLCGGNGCATFADFRACGFRDLFVVATDVSTRTFQVFSADATPQVAVADAVRMSMSIPLYFQAQPFELPGAAGKDYFADGGVMNNYPMRLFDHPRFGKDNPWFLDGINWETLGCHLFTPKTCPAHPIPVTDLVSYIANLFESLLAVQTAAFHHNDDDRARSIIISNCCVAATDFSIRQGDKRYRKLVQAGRAGTSTYLQQYQPPARRVVPHPAEQSGI